MQQQCLIRQEIQVLKCSFGKALRFVALKKFDNSKPQFFSCESEPIIMKILGKLQLESQTDYVQWSAHEIQRS